MMRANSEQLRSLLSITAGAVLLGLFSYSGAASAASNWSSLSDDRFESHTSAKAVEPARELSKLSPFAAGSNNISLDLGQIFLIGDMAKYSDSIGSQLHYSYGVSQLFSFDSSFGYSQHSNGQLSLLTLVSGLRMNMSWYDKVVPYGVFGLGFYKPNYKNPLASESNSSSSTSTSTSNPSLSSILFGVHLGAGVDLALSRNLFFGASLTLHNMFGTSTVLSNGSIFGLGGTYASFLLHIGATF